MTGSGPQVALIHASATSIEPAKQAFASHFPIARLWHLLDDRLVADADVAGGLTPPLRKRMSTLIDYAVAGGADAVQLSCSMYGPVATAAAQPVAVLASDQAMFDRVVALRAARVAVIGSLSSAVRDSVERLQDAIEASQPAPAITTLVPVVVEGAAAAAAAGDLFLLNELMAIRAKQIASHADAIVLAQYSLAPAYPALQAALDIPVLSPPHLAAAALKELLGEEVGA